MTFLLTASGYFYYDEEKTELEKLGFTFKETPNSGPTMLPPWEKDRESVSVEINSLEELMAFSKKQGRIILDADNNSLEIYNDYRE